MAKIITITNQKGGVGKTTTAHALGAYLHREKGAKVLFLDLDYQTNLSYTCGVESGDFDTLQLLSGKFKDISQIEVTADGFHIIPATAELSEAEAIITGTGNEYRLKEALEEIRKEFDYIVIDTPPNLGVITINALTASDYALIPAQADVFSLQGVVYLSETIGAVRKYTNQNLKVLGVILNRHNNRTILGRDLEAVIGEHSQAVGIKVYSKHIRDGVAVREAQTQHQDIFTFNGKSNVAQDFKELFAEVYEDLINE